jgi:hypothetical protein
MKIITIPDLHGKACWQHVEVELYDKVVFLGDYVDSKGELPEELEIENLRQIIALKQRFPEKVVLLIGNHDQHYLHFPSFRASSFNPHIQEELTMLFKSYREEFCYAFQLGNHLWTHAGVSQSWYNEHRTTIEELKVSDPSLNLAQLLNKMSILYPYELAEVGWVRGGITGHGGILWADRSETSDDYLPNYHQYVGHSKVRTIQFVGDKTSSIYYLDCLNSEEKYHVQVLDEVL